MDFQIGDIWEGKTLEGIKTRWEILDVDGKNIKVVVTTNNATVMSFDWNKTSLSIALSMNQAVKIYNKKINNKEIPKLEYPNIKAKYYL